MEESSKIISHKGEKLRQFTVKLKLEAISYARIYNNRAAAKNSIFMKKELGNGQRNKKRFFSLEQRQLMNQRKE